MKRIAVFLSILAIVTSSASVAQNGAKLYQLKCAKCHGKLADGKMGPDIRGRSNTADIVLKGGLKKTPHAKPISGVSENDAKAIADFLK